MNQEWVTVCAVQADGIWVESQRLSACDSCKAQAGCGQKTLTKLGQPVRLWLPEVGDYQLGQQLLLELPQGGLARSALMLYGLPLVFLLVSAMLGRLWLSDFEAVIFALFSLGLGLWCARLVSQRYRHWWQPKIHPSCQIEPDK